ncbi:TPA: restriction endonuclease subunit S [Photobacterium damselae]
MTVESLIIQHVDTWTSAVKTKSTTGRGSSKKLELYGVKKLRELILELAVRGKLVPQDPSDEPASVLLERIAAEKAQLVKEKKIKKQKVLPLITDDEKPFKLPKGWEWERFDLLAMEYSVGLDKAKSKQGEEKEYYYFKMNNIANAGGLDLSNLICIDANLDEVEQYKLQSFDFLFNTRNSKELVGKTCVYLEHDSKPTLYNNNILRAKFCEYSLSFMLDFWMRSPSGKHVLNDIKSGTTNVWAIYQGKLALTTCVIPPLAEQHRIVAKVDELMALCDQLEQQTEASIEAHQLLVSTLLNTLTNSADANELMDNWACISDHFDTLFTTEESIDQLKQTILQLAVMGKLVPQDPNDEPASVLLERIAEEKAQLIEEKKIKKQKVLPPIADDEKPFDLPTGWEWCRLGSLMNLISGQHLKPNEYTEEPLENGNPYITGPAEFGPVYPSFSKYTNEKRAMAEVGDILITCKGAGLGKLNKVNQTLAISRQLMAIQSIGVVREFLFAIVDSKYDYFQSKGVGIAIPGISREDVTDLVVALPPVNEQNQIVSKLTELNFICKQLQARLKESQTTQLHLTDAIVEQAV